MEPERPIEKLLRGYAKKRREEAGTGPELSTATRRLFQSEVARRTAGQPEPGFMRRLFTLRRARLAYALCAAAVVLTAILVSPVLHRPETETRFASPETASSALASRRQEPHALPPTGVPTSAAAPAAVPAPALSAVPAQLALKPTGEPESAPTSRLVRPSLPASRVAKAPASDALKTREIAKTEGQLFKSERFFPTSPVSERQDQANRASGMRSTDNEVLTSFRLELRGNEIRILDNDGSVYSGQGRYETWLETTQTAASSVATSGGRVNPLTNQELDKLGARLPESVYSFRVAGTNRTLNQLVIFTGRLAPVTNRAWSDRTATTDSGMAGQAANRLSPPGQAEVPLAGSRVSGTALVNNRREIQINAVPAKP